MNKECPWCYMARVFLVAVLGIFLAWLPSTQWFFNACSGGCANIVAVLFAPASWIAAMLGEVQGMGGLYFTIGMVFQMWLIWMLVEWLIARKASKPD